MQLRKKETHKRIKSLDDFICRANLIHNNKYIYDQINYIDSKTLINIICSEHGVFKQRPNAHIRGSGCPKCASLKKGASQRFVREKFIEQAIEIHGDKYNYSQVNYKNARSPVAILCPDHGKFSQIPDVHIHGSGCPECGKIKIAEGKKMSIEEFIARASIIHKNKYDYSLVNYKNVTSRIDIICGIHGLFSQVAGLHLLGSGCPACGYDEVSIKNRINESDMITRFKTIHGNKYDYSKVNYTIGKAKIEIICPIHGSFYQAAFNHVSGKGCPKCHESQGERKIRLYLTENKISFISEYRFEDCVDKKPLPFDFYLPDYNMAIEYQGLQHYLPYEKWGGQSMLELVQRHDAIKREFCNNKAIKLEEIKYSDNIEDRLKAIFCKPI